MSLSNGSLANVSESFAAPDLESVLARKAKKERRQRIEGLALGLAVVVALIVGGVTLTSQREASQPPQPLAERPTEAALDTQGLQLGLTRVDVPTNWHTLVGPRTLQVTNFDAGFDDTLCFGGGDAFPRTGVMTVIVEREPREPACADTEVVKIEEIIPFSGVYTVVVAGADASDADIDSASAVWSRDGAVEDPSRPVNSPARVGPYGPSLILGSGITKRGESWAFTVREGEPRAPGETDVRVLAYGEFDRKGVWHGGDVRMTTPDQTPILVVREEASQQRSIRTIAGLADPGAAKLSFTGYEDWISARDTPLSAFAHGQPSFVAHLDGMRLDHGLLTEIDQSSRLFGSWPITWFVASIEGFTPVDVPPGVDPSTVDPSLRAEDEALFSLRVAVDAAQMTLEREDDFSMLNASTLTAPEPPSLTFAAASTEPTEVAFDVRDATSGEPDKAIAFTVRSSSGKCWGALIDPIGTSYSQSADRQRVCDPTDVPWRSAPE